MEGFMIDFNEIEFLHPGQGHLRHPHDPESAAGKAVVTDVLKFGIDIDGTISQAPRHFKRLIDALMNTGNIVYIVTGRDAGRREETEQFLHSLGINYHSMIMKPVEWPGTIAEYKVEVVASKDMHMLIDDEQANCWAVQLQTPAIAALVLPTPELSEEYEEHREEVEK
jgi:uncharacterized HAD superfamily protein